MSTNPEDLPEGMERIFLSQEDVERLIEDDSSDSRIDVINKISTQYIGREFSSNELLYAEQIFRMLVRDAEIRVRATLAEALKSAENAPRDVILDLVKDREAIAAPIIRYSEVLSDADLLRIVENSHEVGKIQAVAQRALVSERVSHALVDTHYPQVVKSLLQNKGAEISGKSYDVILKDHSNDSIITDMLAQRPNLPLPIVEKVISFVSDNVAKELESKYKIDMHSLRHQMRDTTTLQLVPRTISDIEIEATIQQMLMYDRLTPSIVLSALCQGNIRFFEIALARLAKIPKSNASKLIRDKGMYGFEALYDKTEMPESMYEPVKLLLTIVLEFEHNESMHPGTPLYANAIIEKMLARADGQEMDNLPYLIALIRQSITH